MWGTVVARITKRLIVLIAGLVVAAACAPGADEVPTTAASIKDTFTLTGDEYRARLVNAEDLIAACMRAEGFTYQPQPIEAIETESRARDMAAIEEYAKTSGYGISTDIVEAGARAYLEVINRICRHLAAGTDDDRGTQADKIATI